MDLSEQIRAVGIHIAGWCSQKYEDKFSSSKSFQVTLKMDSDHLSCIPFFRIGIEFQPSQSGLGQGAFKNTKANFGSFLVS